MLETLVVRIFAVLGVFLPGGDQRAQLTQPVVELRQERIAVSCVVARPFSDDLLNVIDSGTPVTLRFICRLRTPDGSPAFAPDTTISHRVVKDLSTGTYEVALGSRTLVASHFTEYSQFFRMETAALWRAEPIKADESYIIEVSAELEPIYIHATGQRYDLMALWNYRAPKNKSLVFNGSSLRRRQVAP